MVRSHWLVRTVIPVVAGTLGPLANALSFCAVIQPWRIGIRVDGAEAEGKSIPDPAWLIAVNAISLFFGVLANISFMRALRPAALRQPTSEKETRSKGQQQPIDTSPVRTRLEQEQHAFLQMHFDWDRVFTRGHLAVITIVGWYIAAILLLALIGGATATLQIRAQVDGKTQSFYYATFAAVLYSIVASLMTFAVYRVRHGAHSRGGRTKARLGRNRLMTLTVLFLLYILAGAGVFARVEHWRYLDGVYWADSTLLTIGFGDFMPTTHLGRALMFPYAVVGIVIVATTVFSIAQVARDSDGGSAQIWIARGLWGWWNGRLGEHSRERQFKDMRGIRNLASWIALALWGSAWVALWLVGATVFHAAEREQGWSYFQSMYFSYTSLLVIGYGDFNPQSTFGKAFFVVWSLFAVPVVTILITSTAEAAGSVFLSAHRRKRHVHKTHNNNYDRHHLIAQALINLLRDHLDGAKNQTFDQGEWEYFISLIKGAKTPEAPGVMAAQPDSGWDDDVDHEPTRNWHQDGFNYASEHNPIMMSKPEMEWLMESLLAELTRGLGEMRGDMAKQQVGTKNETTPERRDPASVDHAEITSSLPQTTPNPQD